MHDGTRGFEACSLCISNLFFFCNYFFFFFVHNPCVKSWLWIDCSEGMAPLSMKPHPEAPCFWEEGLSHPPSPSPDVLLGWQGTQLSKANLGHLRPPETTSGYPGPPEAIWGHLRPPQAIRGHLEVTWGQWKCSRAALTFCLGGILT